MNVPFQVDGLRRISCGVARIVAIMLRGGQIFAANSMKNTFTVSSARLLDTLNSQLQNTVLGTHITDSQCLEGCPYNPLLCHGVIG